MCLFGLIIILLNTYSFFSVAEGENWEDSPSPEAVAKWSNAHTIIAQIVAIMPM